MEYVDGRTLRDLLREDRRLLPERALEITDGVLRALDYSHRHGIVHRDIKPANVMLTRSAEVKVMDFGIARAVSDAQATMTQTAQVIGTAQYLSPEQARGERVDARSDLYSTGCLLYELLTGRPPFTGDSPVAIAYQHVRENPVPPSRVDPEIPAWADSIVLKAMAKDPADRYQSAAEMRTDIQRALSGVPVAAPPQNAEMYPSTQRLARPSTDGRTGAIPPYQYGPEESGGRGRGGRKALWWVLAALVVLILLLVGYLTFNNGGKTDAVPSVVGMSQAKAESAIARAGLQSNIVPQASSQYPKGEVASTNPPFGNKVAANSVVTLYVSTGPALVKVPNVVGDQQANAQNILSNKNFNVNIEQDANSTKPSGTVVSQSPAPGTPVAPNSKVTIFVSGGGVPVPNVVNDPQATAQQVLQAAGFSVQVNMVAGPANVAQGIVFQQQPSSGSALAKGSNVTIYVATVSASASPSASATPTGPGGPTPTPTATATAFGQ
jgi:serine/threonine-protein kinase